MRETTSQHIESLRALPRQCFPVNGIFNTLHANAGFRPVINLAEFHRLLDIALSNASNPSETKGKGKKRASPSSSASSSRPQKRVKGPVSGGKNAQHEESSNDNAMPPMKYPHLSNPQFSKPPSATDIPVLEHTFEISYSEDTPHGPMPGSFAVGEEYNDWFSAERKLKETLELLRDLSEPPVFDLGAVGFAQYCGRVVIASSVLDSRDADAHWLSLLPSLGDEVDLLSLGLAASTPTPGNADVLFACLDLQAASRVAITGNLSLSLQPDIEYFPFTLSVKVSISLTPEIYEPIPKLRTKSSLEDSQRRLIQYLYPDPLLIPNPETVTNIPFFYSVLGPAPTIQHLVADRAMQPEELLPDLLPFQRRSVAFLLDREGMMVTPNGEVNDKPSNSVHFSFWERIEEGGTTFFIHRVTGDITPTDPEEAQSWGAILAEEPGLGKTLEIISLLLLNPASPNRNPELKRWDPEANVEVRAVKTTLIVTPVSLATQWVDELKLHAPTLKVLVYDGWTKLKVPITAADVETERAKRLRAASRGKAKAKATAQKKKSKGRGKTKQIVSDSEDDEAGGVIEEVLDWPAYVQGYDVVITTYQTLKTDFNVAKPVPKRPRREDVVYSTVERPRSPLILVEWNRVVMDEVQMVGGGNVEDMVSLIPRLASFAVSGTPARTQVSDLVHVLKFLRVEHLVGPQPRHWARLCLPEYSDRFSAFFRSIAVRTTKASVTAELTIPLQTRYLVGIEMGRVERHVYDQHFESILLELGLDARGVDVRGENKVPDGALLRASIRKLRAICTHPQVGQIGNKLFKPGALKTMEQVLQIMCDENWNSVLDDCRIKVQGLSQMAQLQQLGDDKNRYRHCLETLLLAEKEAAQLIEEIESTIATHEASRGQGTEVERAPSTSPSKGKGKERESSILSLSEVDSDDDTDDDSQTQALKEFRIKRRALKQRLREAKLVMHRVKFLQGDAYHMLGATQSAAEDAAYAEAEKIRRGILKTSEKEANDAMTVLARDVTSKDLTLENLQIETPFLEYKFKKLRKTGGTDAEAHRIKESVNQQEEANHIIQNVLNEQALLLWQWRERLTALLTQQLLPGEEADGQEYQRTLDDQGEAETYLINYAALVADWREALLKERTLLAAHDAREKKLRHTKAAIKAAAALDTPPAARSEHIDLQPEHQVLHVELSTQRKALVTELDGRALKSVVVEMATRMARMNKDDEHKAMLTEASSDLRKLIAEQGALLEQLEADQAIFRKAFNSRLLYFRQLQEISDAVAEVEYEGTTAEALLKFATEQRDLSAKINTNRARQRYLDHLSKDKVSGDNDEDEETCILCKCDFIRGFITHCAHVFCEDCMKAWIAKKQGNTCPVCRVAIDPEKLERFTVAERSAPPKAQAVAEDDPQPVPKSRREIMYNMIDPRIHEEIQAIQSFGDYGAKIQTLVRHLSYIRNADPGAKSIVFSAWADSLYIVERALQDNGIPCLRIDQKRQGIPAVKLFASSEDTNVLLLHGERENAGLNITCASRVFLLESVVHHGFEIQAIARIDRMGQKKSTEVYCYYAEDTIEKNILDLAARQGTSIYTKSNSVGSIIDATSLAGDGEKRIVDSPAKKMQKGDFIFKIDDMLQILFPHMFEDIEYLVSADDHDVPMEDAFPAIPVNAVAGPSRLS
ncbi:SNF2 family helicase [Favolaschia claudopus]|uniref:SNF2 family helicase n=1 Tax=Favolaschia claudopus TaxID=2862362 RepID=A0AAW0BVV4_9AGAR